MVMCAFVCECERDIKMRANDKDRNTQKDTQLHSHILFTNPPTYIYIYMYRGKNRDNKKEKKERLGHFVRDNLVGAR